jgi:hypothetical protein
MPAILAATAAWALLAALPASALPRSSPAPDPAPAGRGGPNPDPAPSARGSRVVALPPVPAATARPIAASRPASTSTQAVTVRRTATVREVRPPARARPKHASKPRARRHRSHARPAPTPALRLQPVDPPAPLMPVVTYPHSDSHGTPLVEAALALAALVLASAALLLQAVAQSPRPRP